MVMEPPNFVVMTAVVVHVEPVPLDNTAVEDLADANQPVLDVNVVMMVVEVSHVENAHLLKHVPMESVLEHPAEIVVHVPVVTTEMEEVVDLVQLAKDAGEETVNAITAARKETVVIVLNLKEQTRDYVLPDLAEPVQLDSLVEPMEDVRLFLNVQLPLQWSIAHPVERLDLPVMWPLA